MISPEEFTEFIATLPVNRLYEYQKIIMDETYNRIVFKGPIDMKKTVRKNPKKKTKKQKIPNFEKLPWKESDRLPGNTNIMKKLGWYYPSKCTAESLESQIKVFAKIMKQLERPERILVSSKMFELLNVNQWYLKENQRFRKSVIKKLDSLSNDDSVLANSIASDFSHFREINSVKVITISDSDSDASLVRKKRKWSTDSDHSDYCPKKEKAPKTVFDYESDSDPEDTTPFSHLPWDTTLEPYPEAVKLVNDFAYFRDLTNDEDTNLEPLIPTNSDYESDPDYGEDGDSLPYPKVIKEQLDRELDACVAAGRAAKITVKSNYLSDSESSS